MSGAFAACGGGDGFEGLDGGVDGSEREHGGEEDGVRVFHGAMVWIKESAGCDGG
jgi:hypothetical protein